MFAIAAVVDSTVSFNTCGMPSSSSITYEDRTVPSFWITLSSLDPDEYSSSSITIAYFNQRILWGKSEMEMAKQNEWPLFSTSIII